jgi:hypothetical protein
MNKSFLKKSIPYLVAILVFVGISLAYFSPVLEGKKLRQSDIIHYKGSAKEITDYRNRTGEEPLWTNSMFGGMPAYQISTYFTSNWMPFFNDIFKLYLPHPANILFLLLIGFFILLMSLKVDPWLGIIGSIGFAFSTYFLLYMEVGHNAQAIAIAYMPAVFAGMIMTYRGKYLLGGALLAFFMALEITVNHVQMTYYLLFLLGIYGIAEFVVSIIKKQMVRFFKATGIALIALIISVGPSITNLWTSYEYMKETIRGGSELTSNQKNKTGGLDKDYITQWSYGVGETFTLMIPDAKGGASEPIGNASVPDNVDRNYKSAIAQQSSYWGELMFTSGPAYAGALMVFLFILGLFIVRGSIKWALFSATILAIMLAWGHNMMWFTDLFLQIAPFYNKFRAVSSWLVIANLSIPLLGILAIKEIIEKPTILKEKQWYFYISLALTAGVALIFAMMPTAFFDFLSSAEVSQFDDYRKKGADPAQLNAFVDSLETARIHIFRMSALRSVLFIILGAGMLFIYSRMKKMSKYIVYVVIGLLVTIDIWAIDKRYLNDKDFAPAKQVETPFVASTADEYILNDHDLDFRVLNMTTSNFTTDAATSYFHKSLGGYHAAKLRRYQELIESSLFPEYSRLVNVLSKDTPDSIRIATLYGLTSFNMLNTRYYIYNPDSPPLHNPAALGNAWFIKNIKLVDDADAELKSMDNFAPANTAIIDKKFESQVSDFKGTKDPGAKITLRSYEPNKLIYDATGLKESQLAVFSEIYYDKGWNVYIDGQPSSYFRANYVLRAMIVPAGDHTIEFRFEPKSFYTGSKISLAGSILLLLVILVALFFEFRKYIYKKPEEIQTK